MRKQKGLSNSQKFDLIIDALRIVSAKLQAIDARLASIEQKVSVEVTPEDMNSLVDMVARAFVTDTEKEEADGD